jgi:two-component system nitrogen regulation response regulator NtrX
LKYLKSIDPLLPVIVISGHGNIETAVAAIRRGAYDFIEKPFKTDRLLHLIDRAIESAALKYENAALKNRAGDDERWIGNSHAAANLRSSIEKVAPTNSRVMITGPAGVGKELAARLIHRNSLRANGPFSVVNAATIAPDQMEIALFGEEDAQGRTTRIGLFEKAHLGTLLLDEVADMPPGTQSKILRVLTEQRFQRVGGRSDVNVDVRVMSATTKDLKKEIEESRFREDLYYRLNVVPLRVPSLAERRDDIADLVTYFIERIADSSGLTPRTFSQEAMVQNSKAGSADLVGLSLRDAREQFEREYLALQITRFNGNISRTAEFIGMERSALHRKLKALGVASGASRQDS